MKIDRKAAFAPHVEALGRKLMALDEPCVGCKGCDGLCQTLIDAIMLPEIILARKDDA